MDTSTPAAASCDHANAIEFAPELGAHVCTKCNKRFTALEALYADKRLASLKHLVERRRMAMNRRWDSVDAEPDWHEKDRVMCSMLFVGTQSSLIDAQEHYIAELERKLMGGGNG